MAKVTSMTGTLAIAAETTYALADSRDSGTKKMSTEKMNHQIDFDVTAGTAPTAATGAIKATTPGNTTPQVVYESDETTPVTVDYSAAIESIFIENRRLEDIHVTISSLTGTGSIPFKVHSWDS